MRNDEERTAYCGLYCGDCIPSNQSLFDTAAKLRQQLDDCQFGEYARLKSASNRTFNAYEKFQEVLDAIMTLRCPRNCFHGGGKPDCAIRACARQKGLEGCWQCEGLEACRTLEAMCTYHGDTVKQNLRMIRQHGAENWSHTRGRHYVWHKSSPKGSQT
jgi:hypothetical protein